MQRRLPSGTHPSASKVRFDGARFAPGVFVLLWSTGFIGAKLGVPYAEPFTFLCLRFMFVIALMLPLTLLLHVHWPRSLRESGHIAVSGALIHGGYLGGCFAAVYHGMPAGMVALIVGLQPVLTGFAAAPLFGERVSAVQWLGLVLGFIGVLMVMWGKLSVDGLSAASVGWAVLALLSITAGTLYQKRFCPRFDLRTGALIQFGAALLLLAPLALYGETREVQWSGEFIFALGWLVLVLSFGAIALLYHLLEHGDATRVASLFFLTPPTTAVLAWLLFRETLDAIALVGMVVAVSGVALAVRRTTVVVPARVNG